MRELVKVEKHGVHVNDRRYKIKSTCFICDDPARPYLKGTKCHSGYNSCKSCTVAGESCGRNGRRVFISLSKPPRTDARVPFRAQIYINHQQVGKKVYFFDLKLTMYAVSSLIICTVFVWEQLNAFS